jgi:hypothetical protein
MASVIDYSIIESDNHAELVEAVADALLDGWQPQGGLVIWREAGSSMGSAAPGAAGGGGNYYPAPPITHYAQALVKYSQ